jgi:hypothetical protein
MGLSLEELELEQTELLPAREVMGLFCVNLCVSLNLDLSVGGPAPCYEPPCWY